MSTKFAVYVEGVDEPIEVAFRANFGKMKWLNPLAITLPYNTPVTPIDNTAQGIFTIGDIIKEIEEQKMED